MLHSRLAAIMGEAEAWELLSRHTDIPVPRLKLLGEAVAAADETYLLAVAERCAAGEPLAYAIGWAPFYGRRFEVTPDVLIPRQETEELVTHALTFSGDDVVLIDCGTGSGCIPVTCALEASWRTVRGCDVSGAALDIAEENAQLLEAPVGFHHLDVTSATFSQWLAETVGSSPCVLTANLPYIPTEGMAALDAEVRREPDLALDGGRHGTEIIKAWLARVREAGLSKPRLLLELDEDNQQDLDAYCAAEGWHITWRRDAAGLLRFCDIEDGRSPRG